jgi:hypothetical protein
MNEPRYQTVKLTKGKHTSPQHGVCVMELASMLAGEPFTDQPTSVSGALATFLRMYNDTVDDRRRQDLYAYASKAVGTAGSERAERDRVERLIGWAEEMRKRRSRHILRRVTGRTIGNKQKDPESAARCAIKAMGKVTDDTHVRALALVDELLEVDASTHAPLAWDEVQEPRTGIGVRETTASQP